MTRPEASRLEKSIRASLGETAAVGRRLSVLERCDSTNDVARSAGEADAPHGTAIIALEQTRGRGRRGRAWATLPGEHLFASLVLRPPLPPERASELTLVAGVALVDALRSLGVESSLKWPNDVEIDGLKVAGILAEYVALEPAERSFVVLGIGVNVGASSDPYPDDVRERATSLAAHASSADVSVGGVAVAVFTQLDQWMERHVTEGFEVIRTAWRERTTMLGAAVRAHLGGQVVLGTAVDLDPTGALLIRDPNGKTSRIVAGDVERVRRA